MDVRYSRLVSLFLGLFELDELERFIRRFSGRSVSGALDRKGSATELVEDLVERLVKRDLVNEELFQNLVASRPDQESRIELVRKTVLGEGSEPAPVQRKGASASRSISDAEVSPERAAWRRKMGDLLNSAPPPPDAPREWIEAAAVLPHFGPATLRPAGDKGKPDVTDSLTVLASLCDTRLDGSWALRLEPRQSAIKELWDERRLGEALKANPEDDSPHRPLMEQIAQTGWIDMGGLPSYESLLAAREIVDWFSETGFSPINPDWLAVMLEWSQKIEPLRKLIGTHFRGRGDELSQLIIHARGGSAGKILGIQGLGGVGKSTLVGKFLLDVDRQMPWVYLDFDDPAVDPTRPERLVGLIARNLSLLYTHTDIAAELTALESTSAGDTLSFTLDVGDNAGVPELVKALDEMVKRLPVREPSLLLVLDTYEQVQVRGRSVTGSIEDFLNMLLEAMPYARVVVSGRARARFADALEIELEDLDTESADAVLQALEVTKQSTRSKIIEKVGTSPLSLRLAAEAIQKGQLTEQDIEGFMVEARRLDLQGQLYTRILGHIQDGEVRRLAHPGLIVRRVTPQIIRDVLSGVCDIDPGRASDLFVRLRDHVTLFEPDATAPDEDEALCHRQDVRETMLNLMINDPEWHDRLKEIHSRAIDYYQGRNHPITRAEEVYHRLMRDDEPNLIDPLWSDDLAGSLGRCWQEPLPDRARVWLGPRIGKVHDDSETWRTADWEVSARREALEYQEMNDPEGVLSVLGQRAERSKGSDLYWYEAEALRRLGRLDDAMTACERGLHSAADAGKLHELLKLHHLAAEIALAQGQWETVRDHVNRAIHIADQLKDAVAHLAAQELLVRAGDVFGQDELTKHNTLQLERSFTKAGDVTLRAASDLSGRILKTAGAQSKSILRKAAVTFGNRSDQDLIKTDAFQLEELLDYANQSEEGKSRLSRLAAEVGLPRDQFELIDLAGSAIRYGRMGDAIATVLDEVGDNEGVRLKAMSMFNEDTMNDAEATVLKR